MYIRLYIWFYIHITRNINIYIYIYICIYIYTHVHIYIYTYTIIHTYIYIYITMCIYPNVYTYYIHHYPIYDIYANRLYNDMFVCRVSKIVHHNVCVHVLICSSQLWTRTEIVPSDMCWTTMAILPILQNWLNKIHDDQTCKEKHLPLPIGSMYGIYNYANIGGILMVNVTIYSIHGSYGLWRFHHIVFLVLLHVSPVRIRSSDRRSRKTFFTTQKSLGEFCSLSGMGEAMDVSNVAAGCLLRICHRQWET